MSKRILTLFALFAAVLLVSFIGQLPTWQVGDWGQFAFYDPGTTLKGDLLITRGYIPTIDFGYTHGLLSLLFGRAGFGLLGRTPQVFWILTLLCEMAMAWGFARLLTALEIGAAGICVMLAALPFAVMPAYLTLTHPLEAALIVWALAFQAEGATGMWKSHGKNAGKGWALALMTVCIFVKPSMAYLEGAVLIALMLWEATWLEGRRQQSRSVLRGLSRAVVVMIILFVGLSLWVGVGPVIRTLLPLTGAKTYAAAGFGFFASSGREFWVRSPWWLYFLAPPGIFLLGALVAAAGCIAALWRGLRRANFPGISVTPPIDHPSLSPRPRAILDHQTLLARRRWQLLGTIGLLHTAFLLGFYGWTGSWRYYSYLPALALVIAAEMLPRRSWRPAAAGVLIAWLLLSHVELIATAADSWHNKQRTAAGLWIYPDEAAEWQQTIAATAGQPTLVMSVGWIPHLPPNLSLPDAWFPERGIPTAREISRVKTQADAATDVILWYGYGNLGLWQSPSFAPERARFTPVLTGSYFTLLRRNGAATTRAAVNTPSPSPVAGHTLH